MEKKTTSRRSFLASSAKATLAITAGVSTIQTWGAPVTVNGFGFATGFKQEPLPYGYDALDKAIDSTTMEIHYSRHAGAYATNLQDAAKAEGVDMNKPLED